VLLCVTANPRIFTSNPGESRRDSTSVRETIKQERLSEDTEFLRALGRRPPRGFGDPGRVVFTVDQEDPHISGVQAEA
jgi:LmbE family N-acetylglucosaminyl deacetylase